jgi:hypothetical protein
MANNQEADSRVFLYEIVIQPQTAALSQLQGLIYRRGKLYLKVPYPRMSQTMQQIARLGGQIISITPLAEAKFPQNSAPPLDLPWWVEISTAQPHCLYYFGPFESADEAQAHQPGYFEDLQIEGAQGITTTIKQGQPEILTQEWES